MNSFSSVGRVGPTYKVALCTIATSPGDVVCLLVEATSPTVEVECFTIALVLPYQLRCTRSARISWKRGRCQACCQASGCLD